MNTINNFTLKILFACSLYSQISYTMEHDVTSANSSSRGLSVEVEVESEDAYLDHPSALGQEASSKLERDLSLFSVLTAAGSYRDVHYAFIRPDVFSLLQSNHHPDM